jgi:hypothetical protein
VRLVTHGHCRRHGGPWQPQRPGELTRARRHRAESESLIWRPSRPGTGQVASEFEAAVQAGPSESRWLGLLGGRCSGCPRRHRHHSDPGRWAAGPGPPVTVTISDRAVLPVTRTQINQDSDATDSIMMNMILSLMAAGRHLGGCTQPGCQRP